MELHVPAHATTTSATNGALQDEHHGTRRATAGQDGQPLADISNSSRIGMSMSGLCPRLLHAPSWAPTLWWCPRKILLTCHTCAMEVCSTSMPRMLILQAVLLQHTLHLPCPLNLQRRPLRACLTLPGADWGAGKHDAGHWIPELLSCPPVTGPILGPSVPAGAATGNLVASYSQYDALEASEAGSSRGDEEEGLVGSVKAAPRVPWYKDFQVGRLIRHPVTHQQSTPALITAPDLRQV